MPSLKALVLFAAASLAAVLPPPGRDDAKRSEMPTQTEWVPPHGARAVAVTPSVSMPIACDYAYCDGTSSWCFYWAGVTAYDPQRGPVPGETITNIGPCSATPAPSAQAGLKLGHGMRL